MHTGKYGLLPRAGLDMFVDKRVHARASKQDSREQQAAQQQLLFACISVAHMQRDVCRPTTHLSQLSAAGAQPPSSMAGVYC